MAGNISSLRRTGLGGKQRRQQLLGISSFLSPAAWPTSSEKKRIRRRLWLWLQFLEGWRVGHKGGLKRKEREGGRLQWWKEQQGDCKGKRRVFNAAEELAFPKLGDYIK